MVFFGGQILIGFWGLVRLWFLSEIEDILRFEVFLGSFWFIEIFKFALSHINMIGWSWCLERQFKLRVLVFMDMKILIVCIVVIIKGLRVGNWLIVVDLGFLFKGLGKAESFGGFFVLEGI